MAGMVVQHNLNAINANNKMNINVSGTKKATEKLSSGYQINRAGDNAAGLAISEKMRSQIRGLSQATKNANDGISLIQTAEGAMDQQHAILQRTRELLVQASNSGVLDGTAENDFQKIQDEIDTLKSEYERINPDTEFNRKKLLDGSYKDQYLQLGANNAQGIGVTIKTTAWDENLYLSKTTEDKDGTATGQVSNGNAQNGKIADNDKKVVYEYNKDIFTVEATKKVNNVTFTSKDGTNYSATLADGKTYTKTQIDDALKGATGNDMAKLLGYADAIAALDGTDGYAKKLDTTDATFSVTDVDGKKISGLLDNVDTMIKSVTTERSKLGAVQNRLEYTVKVDDNTSENLQSAESRIRDTDMADEMTRFSKESILQQAATSMLAQAEDE